MSSLISRILARRSVTLKVLAHKNALRKSHKGKCHEEYKGSIPGENLPFRIGNKNAVTLRFVIFFASGFWAPWAVVCYQLLAK